MVLRCMTINSQIGILLMMRRYFFYYYYSLQWIRFKPSKMVVLGLVNHTAVLNFIAEITVNTSNEKPNIKTLPWSIKQFWNVLIRRLSQIINRFYHLREERSETDIEKWWSCAIEMKFKRREGQMKELSTETKTEWKK